MNRLIKKIHTYLGLLNLSFLLIFGLTGIYFALKWPGESAEPRQEVRYQEFTSPAQAMDDRDLGERIRQELHIAAVSLDTHRNRDNDLVLDFYTHRGARRVTVLEKEHRLRIAFTPDSAWGFIDNLHATENRDVGDWRVRLWSWYNEFAIWSLIAMAITGLYLWISSRPRYRLAQVSLVLGSGAFLLLYWLSR